MLPDCVLLATYRPLNLPHYTGNMQAAGLINIGSNIFLPASNIPDQRPLC